MNQKNIIALELSGSQVKGALAAVPVSNGSTAVVPTIEAIVTENSADCVQYGRVQNVINAAKITDVVLKALESSPAIDGGTINGAYVALSGRSLGSEKVSAEIVLQSEMVITNEILMELFKEAAKKASQGRQVLKVLHRKYVVDTQTMPNPVGALGQRLRGDFTLVTCNPTNQRNIDLMASEKDIVALGVKDYVVTPLAVADMVLDEEAKQRGCVLVDIGYQTITISIYKDRALQYLATLPIGSHNITKDLSVGLNWTMEKAERMKCTEGDAMSENTRGTDETARMNAYITARAYEIVANINANIDYAGYKAADLPAGIVLTGRGSHLLNLDALIAAQSKMKVSFAKFLASVKMDAAVRHVDPDDYMSLIAVVMRICRNGDFSDCVTSAVKPVEEPVVTTPTPQPPVVTPVAETPKKVEKAPVEEKWAEDDPDPDDEKTKKNSRKGLISSVRDKWLRIMNSSIDDADISES